MADAESARQLRAVEIKADGDMIAAKIVGPIIEANRAQVILDDVGRAIDEAGSGLRFMVLDFDEVTFINSTGIGTCLELGTRAKAKAALPILYRLTKDVTEILTRCKADTIYTIVQSQDELAKVLAD
ncbi:MAG: STAS domain-containing protein [Planctomycetota bacterium]|jgi:anti-anti-sigma regulatory factor